MASSVSARRPLFEAAIVRTAALQAIRKLHPAHMIRNPVMFVVEVGSAFTSVLWVHAIVTGRGEASLGFILTISIWLWLTVPFANFAEAMAEGRGKAQADTLRKARKDVSAKRLAQRRRDASSEEVPSVKLRSGDVVLVDAGELIPADGEAIEGVASVDESAITGESAPVIRESGGDRSAVTGGTRVLSDWLVVRVSDSHSIATGISGAVHRQPLRTSTTRAHRMRPISARRTRGCRMLYGRGWQRCARPA